LLPAGTIEAIRQSRCVNVPRPQIEGGAEIGIFSLQIIVIKKFGSFVNKVGFTNENRCIKENK